MARRRGRALRRRYGRAGRDAYASRTHLPRSRYSFADYIRRVDESLGSRPSVGTERERLMVKGGWLDGKKPETVASQIAIARLRG